MLGGLKFGSKKKKKEEEPSSKKRKLDDSKPDVSKYAGTGQYKAPAGGGIYYPGQPHKNAPRSTSSANRDALEALKRGGLASSVQTLSSAVPSNPNAVAMRPKPDAVSEDLRASELRRGNLKRSKHQSEYSNPSDLASSKTLQDLVDAERGAKSIDEVYLRNLNRVGSRYKGGEFSSRPGEENGFDEEDQIDMTMFTDKSERVTELKAWEREKQQKVSEGQVRRGEFMKRDKQS